MDTHNNSILGQMNGGFPNERINGLVDSLLKTPFILSHQFNVISLEDLGQKLFDAKEQAVLTGAQSEGGGIELSDELQQIDRCVHDYCLLLQELENEHLHDFTAQTLNDLRGRETKTQLLKAVVMPAEEMPPGTNAEESSPLDWGKLDTVLPEEPLPLASEAPAVSDWMSEAHEPTSALDLKEFDLPLQPPPASSDNPFETTAWKAEDGAPEEEEKDTVSESDPELLLGPTEESISKWVELPPIEPVEPATIPPGPARAAPPEVKMAQPPPLPKPPPLPVEDPFVHSAPEPEPLEVESLLTPETSTPTPPTSDVEKYWKSGETLHTNVAGLPEGHALRLSSICFCLSVEKQLHLLFQERLYASWAERAIPVVNSLDTQNRRFDLKPGLREYLDKASRNYTAWTHEGRLPFSGIVNSLRYLLATEDTEKFRPSLLDWGVVLMWLGSEADRGGVTGSNLLGIQCPDEELIEATFRLFRLNKLRLRALSTGQTFDEDLYSLVKQDAARLNDLLSQFKLGEPEWPFE